MSKRKPLSDYKLKSFHFNSICFQLNILLCYIRISFQAYFMWNEKTAPFQRLMGAADLLNGFVYIRNRTPWQFQC